MSVKRFMLDCNAYDKLAEANLSFDDSYEFYVPSIIVTCYFLQNLQSFFALPPSCIILL